LGNKETHLHNDNGPKDATTMVVIVSRGPILGLDGKYRLLSIRSSRAEVITDLGLIKCIRLGLYDYVDDVLFAQWFKEYSYFNDEAFVIKEAITSPPHEELVEEMAKDTDDCIKNLSQQFNAMTLEEISPMPIEDTPLVQQSRDISAKREMAQIVEEPNIDDPPLSTREPCLIEETPTP